MATVHEAFAGFTWLYSILSADATLAGYAPGGIWRGMADPNTATPFIVMALQAGIDTTTTTGYRVLVDALYQVKAVGPAASTAQIASAAARLDALIGTPPTSGSVTGGQILSSSRQSFLMVDSLVNGEMWTDMGGLYRLVMQQV